jgi:hypothetical protein
MTFQMVLFPLFQPPEIIEHEIYYRWHVFLFLSFQVTSIKMDDDKELVCIDYDDLQQMVVVGSLEGSTVYDTRSGEVVLALAAYDAQWGVRSVNLRQHILASGGGYGSLGFFDIRKGATEEGFIRLINCENKDSITASPGFLVRALVPQTILCLKIADADGVASVLQDKKSSFYASYLGSTQDHYAPAIYTIQWDPTGTRLFAAGGPIMVRLFSDSLLPPRLPSHLWSLTSTNFILWFSWD